jgi:DNA repair protein SbcC/Rad50
VIKVRHEGAVAGLAAWSSADELKRCEGAIANWIARKNCTQEEELSVALEKDIQARDKHNADLAEIDRQRNNIRVAVREQNRRIQEITLQPLNGLLNAFNTALVADQTHEIRLDCRFGIGAAAGILAKDVRGNEVIPELYLSEGQLGAVNLALLFSANLTYPWSRWPAILIDDPLQYSDIVSASAFMDLICNLVKERNMQIILSTHDSGEADFCRRKCIAAKIQTQDCQLLANSQDGVQYRNSWEAC